MIISDCLISCFFSKNFCTIGKTSCFLAYFSNFVNERFIRFSLVINKTMNLATNTFLSFFINTGCFFFLSFAQVIANCSKTNLAVSFLFKDGLNFSVGTLKSFQCLTQEKNLLRKTPFHRGLCSHFLPFFFLLVLRGLIETIFSIIDLLQSPFFSSQ